MLYDDGTLFVATVVAVVAVVVVFVSIFSVVVGVVVLVVTVVLAFCCSPGALLENKFLKKLRIDAPGPGLVPDAPDAVTAGCEP
jgi:uncharacterized membrane protein YhaH (DUF805 family)